MYREQADLGICPECGGRVPESRKLIEYETAGGESAMFVECPDCTAVVHPR